MLAIEQLIKLGNEFTLQTERLNLRRFKSTDLAEEIEQQQNPDVVRYIREPMSNEEAVVYFEQFIQPYKGEENEWLGICVERAEDGQTVGAISFRIESLEFAIFEIGYRFNPKFQGKGFATEAVAAMVKCLFDTVKAHKVVAYCDPENAASYRIMEKLSMQQEGHLRQHYKVGDQWRDCLVYGIIEDEF